MTKNFFIITTFLLMTLLSPLSICAQEMEIEGLKVTPTQIEVSTEPGKSISGEILIENRIAHDIEFNVYSQDIISTLDGTTYGMLNKDDPHSVAHWITYKENNYYTERNSQLKIPYTIAVPNGIKAGSYWGITFLEIKNIDQQNEKNVTVGSRIGIKMLIKVQPIKKIEISEIKIIQNALHYKEVGIELNIKNIGSLGIQPKGSVSISEGENFDNLELKTDLINPGDEATIRLSYNPRKFFKKYSVIATIDEIKTSSRAVDFLIYPYFIGYIFVFSSLSIIVALTIYKRRKKK